MSVLSYLDFVASKLELSYDEKVSIDTSISTLVTRLENYDINGDIIDKYKFGSFDRGTILPRVYDSDSDVDYMVVFKEPFKVQPQSRLNWLKRFAEEKYSRSEIHQDYPTIALELNHIRFELVPAVEMESSYNLQIPAPHSSYLQWIYTNPSEQARLTEDADRRTKGVFRKLVRIMKYWNIKNGRIYSSYQLEQSLSKLVYFGENLEDMFYYAVKYLPTIGLSDTERGKVDELKNKVETVKRLHDSGLEPLADLLIRQIIPM